MSDEFFQVLPNDFYVYASEKKKDCVLGVTHGDKVYEVKINQEILKSLVRREASEFEHEQERKRRQEEDAKRRAERERDPDEEARLIAEARATKQFVDGATDDVVDQYVESEKRCRNIP